MKICVLLASYNGAKYIESQVESILNQSGVEIDIYISDDRSTDNTFEILTEKYSIKKNVFITQQKISTCSAAANFFSLIEIVNFEKYDYVAFSDQDDIWYQDKLQISVNILNKGYFDAVSTSIDAFWEDKNKIFVNKAQDQKKYDYLFESAGPGCTYVMTRAFATSFKLFYSANKNKFINIYYHDWVIYAYARSKGFKWQILSYSTMLYRQHSTNHTGINLGLNAFKKRFLLIKEQWYWSQILEVSKAVDSIDTLEKIINKNIKIAGVSIPSLNILFQFRRKKSESLIIYILIIIGLIGP